MPFLPSDFFLPGESSTREYLPSCLAEAGVCSAATTTNLYAPPPPPAATHDGDAKTREGRIGTGMTSAGWDIEVSEVWLSFRVGVKTRGWDERH